MLKHVMAFEMNWSEFLIPTSSILLFFICASILAEQLKYKFFRFLSNFVYNFMYLYLLILQFLVQFEKYKISSDEQLVTIEN